MHLVVLTFIDIDKDIQLMKVPEKKMVCINNPVDVTITLGSPEINGNIFV